MVRSATEGVGNAIDNGPMQMTQEEDDAGISIGQNYGRGNFDDASSSSSSRDDDDTVPYDDGAAGSPTTRDESTATATVVARRVLGRSFRPDDDDDDDNETNKADMEEDDDDEEVRAAADACLSKEERRGTRVPLIMGASNQTDAERCLLRQCQRDLHNRIAVGRVGEYAADDLDCWRARNNELGNTCYSPVRP